MIKNLLPVAATLWAATLVAAADTADEKITALVKQLSAREEPAQAKAAAELGKLGKPAAGPVAAALKSKDPQARLYAVQALGLIGPDAADRLPDVVRLLGDHSERVRKKAADAVSRLAPEAKDALPALLRAMADANPDARDEAASAAAKYGPVAVPALVEALKSPEWRVRRSAAQALGEIGPKAADAVDALAALSRDPDARAAGAALLALGKVGKPALPALTAALQSDDPLIRNITLSAVGKVASPEARQLLADSLKSPLPDVRRSAALVMSTIPMLDRPMVLGLAEVIRKDPDDGARSAALSALSFQSNTVEKQALAKPALPAAGAALLDDNPFNRSSAYYLVGSLGGGDVNKILQNHLKGKDPLARVKAARLLASMNVKNAEAVEALRDGLGDKQPAVRYEAAFGLAALGKDAPAEAVDVIVEALKDKNPQVRRQAAAATMSLRERANKALPAMLDLLKDEDQGVRRQATTAVGSLGGDGKTVLPALAEAAEDRDFDVRHAALGSMGEYAPDAVPYFAKALKDRSPDSGLRLYAVAGLGKRGVDPKAAVPLLAEALKDESPNVRDWAAGALANHGDVAVPYLTERLQDDNARVRAVAAENLGRLGRAAGKAAPALAELARYDDRPDVRAAALGALEKLGEDALPGLAELVAARDPKTQQAATKLLKGHGAKAVPALVGVLKSGDEADRPFAARALGDLGPDAKDAVPALREAAKSPDPALSKAAEQALSEIEEK